MQRADAALELLLTDDDARASEVARELDFLNRDRQEAETRILFAAEAAAAAQAHQAAIVVAGEGWHPGVVGIVASRLVERWRRPCVVIALDGAGGRGSGRSISAYDLHAGLAACSEHLTRFGGHRMAAGVELDADSVEPFRRALAAHAAAAALAGRPHPRRARRCGRPRRRPRPRARRGPRAAPAVRHGQPAADAARPRRSLRARHRHGRGEGALPLHPRDGRRQEVTRSGLPVPPERAAPAAEEPHDIALRLEKNRWNGADRAARAAARALPDRARRAPRARARGASFWDELRGARWRPAPHQRPQPMAAASSRTGAARALPGWRATSSPAGSRCSSPSPMFHAGAPGSRPWSRGCPRGRCPWCPGRARPRARRSPTGFGHLVALDPPPGGAADPLLGAAPRAHLAWGPVEAEFAMSAYRAALDLRPQLTEVFLALRELPPDARRPRDSRRPSAEPAATRATPAPAPASSPS